MLICLLYYAPLQAAGLNTDFSTVTLDDLKVGGTYRTGEMINLPLKVENTGSEPVDLTMEVLSPQDSELKEGFEPIPQISWIKLQKSEFKDVMPNAFAVTDVIVSIPRDNQYKSKQYQVFIWTHTVGKMVSIGLKSKLLLKIKNE